MYKFVIPFVFTLTIATLSHGQNDDSSGSSVYPKVRPVETRSDFKPHVGLLAGVISPEGSYDSGSELGVDIGFQPYIPFATGLEIAYSRAENRNEVDDLNRTTVLAKVSYNFGGDMVVIKDSYAGLGLGAAVTSDTSRWVSAPILGFDITVRELEQENQKVSLGAMAKYAIYEGSDADTFSINGLVKYWF